MNNTRIEIDTDSCIGSGMCEAAAPDLFEVRDDGLSHVLAQPADEDEVLDAQEAAHACPVRAVLLTTD